MSVKRLRILHALGTLDPGGVETWLLNVLRYINRDRFQFDFCTFGPRPGLYAAEIEKLGGKVLRCPKGANLWSFGRRFRKILREGHYDIVHSHVHLFSGAILRWAKVEGVAMRIAHSHTSRDDKPDTPARRAYRRLMKSWINRYATQGLAVSRLAAAALFGQNWQADNRFRVLHCGIDIRPFEEPVSREDVRNELGIPPDAPVVGHVGSFIPRKNHLFLLEVAAEILKTRPDVYFLLIGDGPLRPHIEARSKAMGLSDNILFAGIRTDVPQLMRGGMDAFLFPSLWEGLPVSLIEAQAAGLNCIVSHTVCEEAAYTPESIQFLPLSVTADSWAGHVVEKLGTRGREFVPIQAANGQFSIQQSVGALVSVYSSIPRTPNGPVARSSGVSSSDTEWQVYGGLDYGASHDLQAGIEEWSLLRKHLQQYGLNRMVACIELGCGAGRLTNALAQDFATVHALDVSDHRLRQAKGVPNSGNIHFHLVGGPAIPLADGTCDLCISTHVFQHIAEKKAIEAYLREMHRVLRPDGCILIHVPVIGAHEMKGSLAEVMRRRGKEILKGGALAITRQLMRAGFHRLPWKIDQYRVFSFVEFNDLLSRLGFVGVELRILDWAGGHGYVFAKPDRSSPRTR